jgi:hypothetical protein
MKRLIDWLVGKKPGSMPVEWPETATKKGNIFLGRDLEQPTPDSVKVVRWIEPRDSGSDSSSECR